MKKVWLTAAMAALLMVGCNGEKDVETNANVSMHIVEVEILTAEQVNVNEPLLLEAQVTQGGEFVNDADDVTFEVWESGLREQGQMLLGELTEDGKYSVEHTFAHDGVYYVYAHTNARGLHIMPKQQIIAGNPDMSKVLPDSSSDSMEHVGGHGEDSGTNDEMNHGEEDHSSH